MLYDLFRYVFGAIAALVFFAIAISVWGFVGQWITILTAALLIRIFGVYDGVFGAALGMVAALAGLLWPLWLCLLFKSIVKR